MSQVTGPGIVDVVAAALYDTPYESVEDCARAVLAALTEAGTVEWGVRRVGYPTVRPHTNEASARWIVEECQLEGNPDETVSRLTLPWTAVE